MGKPQPRQEHLHHGKQHPEMKNRGKRTSVHTHSSPRHPKRLLTNFSTQQTRPQQLQENVRITQEQKPLERHTEISTPTMHKLQSMRKTIQFIALDLIGEFHPASSRGNRYALTTVCMLTGFTFCIPLKSKCAEDVIKAYIDHICCPFRPSK